MSATIEVRMYVVQFTFMSVFRIQHVLVRIRILGFVIQTSTSGSFILFGIWKLRTQIRENFFPRIMYIRLFHGTIYFVISF
jgi:hypothetical protein